MPGEQGVLASQRQGPDGALDGVVVDLDAAVSQEQGQTRPARQGVADGFGQLGLLADGRQLGAQPGLQLFDQRLALLQPDRAARLGIKTADLRLDGIERLDPLQGLRRDGRMPGGGQLVEAAADMGPAESALNLTLLRQGAIAGITVDLKHALEDGQVRHRPLGLAVGRIDIRHGRRVQTAPRPVVPGRKRIRR